MLRLGNNSNDAARRPALGANLVALAVLALLVVGMLAPQASAAPETTRLVYRIGKIVPIPASIPHEAGDMVDRRIVPDLVWIAQRYPIYVTDGYSGPLPSGEHAGCDRCHTRHSDHYNGLAVDIVPVGGGTTCDRSWAGITRLARWAEPVQNHPVAPFRWVGYDGDAGHGCGHHLHLSWNHAIAPEYSLAEWVEVLSRRSGSTTRPPSPSPETPPAPPGPYGGISQYQPGGVSARD